MLLGAGALDLALDAARVLLELVHLRLELLLDSLTMQRRLAAES